MSHLLKFIPDAVALISAPGFTVADPVVAAARHKTTFASDKIIFQLSIDSQKQVVGKL